MKLTVQKSIVPRRTPENGRASQRPAVQLRRFGRSETMTLFGTGIAAAARPATRRELIDRLFSISAVNALRLDPARGTARLTFASSEISTAEALEALAMAMRARSPARLALPGDALILKANGGEPLSIWRGERGLTLWRVEELNAGRFRLSHPLLRDTPLREEILDALSGVAGVTRQSPSLLRPGSIDVRCEPHRVTAGLLLEVLEPALAARPAPGPGGTALRDVLVAANLALSPISDFVFPPLGIANAALVWLLNIEHIIPAALGLRERRCTLELLYLTVGAFTLLTFHFFGSALMYAALALWPKAVRGLRLQAQRQFLARYRRRPHRVWIERDGALVESSVEALPPGQIVVLREGDTIPGDGVLLEGGAKIRESWITGATGAHARQPGDALYASSEVREGEIRMRVDEVGHRTAAGRLASWFEQALRQPPRTPKASRLAEGMVLPALIVAAAAISRGGLGMAKAVARPDYFTGASIAEELSGLITIMQAAEAGMYLGDPGVLDRVTGAECWIFDDSVPWHSGTSAEVDAPSRLRAQGVTEVLFLSSRPSAEAARLAHELGFDTFQGECTTDAKKMLIAQRQFLGKNVLYFGDCTREAPAADQADLAISVLDHRAQGRPKAPLVLFRPDLALANVLHTLSRARSTGVHDAFATSLVPNIIAVTGGLYLNFSVLTSVILTNLGTLASYYRWRKTLRSAE